VLTGDEEPAASGGSDPGTSQSPGPTDGSASTSPSDGATDETPTAEELENFAASYVQTASEDPAAGFTHLTPAYQAQSTEYEQFWGAVRSPRILDISADPAAMTVTYTYRYALKGDGNRTETVTLHLVRKGDRLLIDGAS
jgi:hypothetical protein